MNKDISIIGIGGHSRSVVDLLESQGYTVHSYFDENGSDGELIMGKIPWGGSPKQINTQTPIVLAIGNNQERKNYYHSIKCLKKNILHNSVIKSKYCSLGESNLIFANAYLGANAKVGVNNIINTKAIVEHETIIGNHCHISIGSILAGRVEIGNECFIGAGAIIKDKISICDNTTIGAGAVVVKSINTPGVYVGIPAKE